MAQKFSVPDVVDAFDDVAGFIASPPEGRPMAQAIGESGQQFCDAWSAMPPWLKNSLDLQGLNQARAGRKLADLVCKPYFDDKGYTPPEFNPPFSGGQCQGLSYRAVGTLEWDVLVCSTGTIVPVSEAAATEAIFIGPVVSVTPRYFNPGSCGNKDFIFDVVHNGGATTSTAFFKTNPLNHVLNARFSGSFELAGGGDGGCGNPPATEFEPGANPAPAPVQPPAGQEPGFDPDGQPFFYVPDFPGDGGDDQPLLPFNPEGGTGGEPAPTEPEPGDESEGEGSGQGGGDNDFGEPPEGQRWVGCEVTLSDLPPGTGIIPQSLPQTVYTAVQGNARLRFDSSAGSGYDTPIAIKSKSVWVWEPVRGANPSGVFVNVRPGIAYTVRPYSVPLEN